VQRPTVARISYLFWQERGRKRGGRWEPTLFGTLEADDDAAAKRLTAEKWPGLRLEIVGHRGDDDPRSPPRGA
jgi:hypothetical protein